MARKEFACLAVKSSACPVFRRHLCSKTGPAKPRIPLAKLSRAGGSPGACGIRGIFFADPALRLEKIDSVCRVGVSSSVHASTAGYRLYWAYWLNILIWVRRANAKKACEGPGAWQWVVGFRQYCACPFCHEPNRTNFRRVPKMETS